MATAATHFDNSLRYRESDAIEQTHLTPAYALDPITVDLGGRIGLDPCTLASNPTRAGAFYTVEHDGLACTWAMYPSIFVNPPYGKAREPWVKRCIEAGARGQKVILLIPAATDTRIWQQAVASADAVVLIRGRLKFGTLRPNRRQHAASHPSSVIGWNTDLAATSKLGLLLGRSPHSTDAEQPSPDSSPVSLSVQEGLMGCGHPLSAVVSADEGTKYCGRCEDEARAVPDGSLTSELHELRGTIRGLLEWISILERGLDVNADWANRMRAEAAQQGQTP